MTQSNEPFIEYEILSAVRKSTHEIVELEAATDNRARVCLFNEQAQGYIFRSQARPIWQARMIFAYRVAFGWRKGRAAKPGASKNGTRND